MKKKYFPGKFMRSCVIVGAMLTLSGILCAQTREMIAGEKDGLRLIFRIPDQQNPSDPELICEVQNITNKTVNYDDNGDGSRFAFRLLDLKGTVVTPERKWAWSIDPTSDARKHEKVGIPPGGRMSYTLRLKEAYDSRWSSGARLEVSWNPGYMSGKGSYDVGWGLHGTFDMKKLLKVTDIQSPEASSGSRTNGSTNSDPRRQPNHEGVQGPSESGQKTSPVSDPKSQDTVTPQAGVIGWALGSTILFVLIGIAVWRVKS